ncbi:MAG: peptidylprolyl isomerase [Acidimicrobiia bacterium]|nr:peptidylprolyl isomerase [Acidimicrobiia bacterium]
MPRPQKDRDRERAARREEAMRAASERAARRRRWIALLVVGSMLLATVGAIIAVAAEGGGQGVTTTTTFPPPPTTAQAPPADLEFPAAGAAAPQPLDCPAEDGSAPRLTAFPDGVPDCLARLDDGTLDPAVSYRARIRTTEGDLVFRLHSEFAPETVNAFVVLSRYHFFDGAPFDLIWPFGWAEAGGAFGNEALGAGFTLPSEAPEVGSVPTPGSLAFHLDADGRSEPGRLIVALGDNAADLPPSTTIFGLWLEPADGLRPFQRAATESGAPSVNITIEGIDIEPVVDQTA